MRGPTKIRGTDVLAAFGETGEPRTATQIAGVLGVHPRALPGHLAYLMKKGDIARVAPGQFVRAQSIAQSPTPTDNAEAMETPGHVVTAA